MLSTHSCLDVFLRGVVVQGMDAIPVLETGLVPLVLEKLYNVEFGGGCDIFLRFNVQSRLCKKGGETLNKYEGEFVSECLD